MSNTNHTYILGISAFYHDSAACLVRDGEIIAAAQEERFTRKKHDADFPKQAVAYCLKEAGITIKDVQYVAYYEKPFLKFERLLLTYLQFAPQGLISFLKAMPVWLKEKIFLKDYLLRELDFDGEIIFPEHHESHAASAFYPSPFQEAAILTMDGVGEWTTTSFGVGKGNQVELLSEMHFPHSLGLLYSAFTYYTGFRVNSGEYKLMGLAPYGKPSYRDLIRKELIDLKDDGSFKLNMKYFNYSVGLTMTNARFHALLGGPPRRPETKITQREADIARSIQEVTEEIMIKMANHVQKVTGMDNLCLAGGVALNCVGNGKILRQTRFKKLWIQPAAGDAGSALGAALFVWHKYLGKSRQANNVSDSQKGSFLGPRFSENDIQILKDKYGATYTTYDEKTLAAKIAQGIDEQKVIGLCHGRMEFGPRALGGRSIIGDARSQKMQSILNLKIKFRESFRPFAPSVLKDKVSDYFELNGESPYMLLVAPVQKNILKSGGAKTSTDILEQLKKERSTLPAITHVDNSARIQTVSKDTNPFYYQIIEEFFKRTGCAVIINTSFNIRGEPIVCTPQDAYRCFMCTDMDYLVVENCFFDKMNQPQNHKFKKEDISQILD